MKRNLTLELHNFMCDGKRHTTVELLRFGHRISARIYNLRKYGAVIKTAEVSTDKFEYKMEIPADFRLSKQGKIKPFPQLEIMENPINVGEVKLTWFEKIVDKIVLFFNK